MSRDPHASRDRSRPGHSRPRLPAPTPHAQPHSHASKDCEMSDTSFDLGANNTVPLTVIATDAAGNVVPGLTPVLTSSDETVATVSADGVVVRVALGGGSATVTATVT